MRQKEEAKNKLDKINIMLDYLERNSHSEEKEFNTASIAIKEYFKGQKEILEWVLEDEKKGNNEPNEPFKEKIEI